MLNVIFHMAVTSQGALFVKLYLESYHLSLNRLETPYRKVPKFSDARKFRCNIPKIQIKRLNLRGYFFKMVQME